ncbi:hypothetical protein BJ085DRAFT_39396, partial [Dimargaris cristalligena]
MQFKSLITIASLAMASSMVNAHEYITSHCIRGSPKPECQGKTGAPDYDSASPIASFGVASMPLCRYPKGQTVATFKAGETVKLEMEYNAPHKGGHCEVSISINDKDFVSIRTKTMTCLVDTEGLSLSAVIPANAPTLPKATLAWTWINAEGNREFYMNCIDISIEGVAGGSIVGPPTVFANYPVNGPPVIIGQFEHGADPRLDLYTDRPQLTLTANGVSSGGAPASTPVATPTATASSTPSDTPVPTTPAGSSSSSEVAPPAATGTTSVANTDVAPPAATETTPVSNTDVTPPAATSTPAYNDTVSPPAASETTP